MTAASGERPINDKQTRIHLPVLRREKQTAHHMRHLRCEKENNPEERDLEESEMKIKMYKSNRFECATTTAQCIFIPTVGITYG